MFVMLVYVGSWSHLGAKMAPRGPKKAQEAPKTASKTDFGHILIDFWTDSGLILNRFWIDFGSILNHLGIQILINSKQCLDSKVKVERLLSSCRIIRSHARLFRSYNQSATQCHCLAYLFACLLTCFLACLLSSLLTCLLACLLVCLLAYLPACLLTYLIACLLTCLLLCLLVLLHGCWF